MSKKERTYTKIKRLCKSAALPRWMHRFGPKRFQTWELVLGLIIKQVFRLSYRRASRFLEEYYGIVVHWTTLQKAAQRFPKWVWQSLLATTIIVDEVTLAAVDGTGIARSNASQHYLKRIGTDTLVQRPLQLCAMIDVKRRKFLATTIRVIAQGETHRVPTLYNQSPIKPNILLMDKGFDAEWLHQWLGCNGTFSIAPVRKNCKRGRHRKLMRDCMDWCLYWQRNIVESLFSALKRLFGSSVSAQCIRTQSAELFCRLIAYNIGLKLYRDFLQSRCYHNSPACRTHGAYSKVSPAHLFD